MSLKLVNSRLTKNANKLKFCCKTFICEYGSSPFRHRALQTEFGIECHASWTFSHSAFLFRDLMGSNFSFAIDHWFSIEFKFEDCAGKP